MDLPMFVEQLMTSEPTTQYETPRSHPPEPTVVVLLVEDDAAVRNLVTRLLTLHGYRVLCASSGHAALPLWEAHRREIDLLLTDVVMPGELNGRELARYCSESSPALKVLYTSGYNMELSAADGSLHEGINFLQKPYRPEHLLEVVRAVLAEAPGATPNPYVAGSPC